MASMQVPVLISFTTQYCEREDRLRLVGRDSADKVQTLWMTRRMADLLVTNLSDILNERQGHDAPEVGIRDLVQAFEQHAAQAAFAPTPAVRADNTDPDWLITTIDLKTSNEAVVIIFKCNQTGANAGIAFKRQQLRQWLAIVLQGYQAGGWPLLAWPDWIHAQPIEPPVATAAMH